jgi:hypothetical protein
MQKQLLFLLIGANTENKQFNVKKRRSCLVQTTTNNAHVKIKAAKKTLDVKIFNR